MNKKLVFFTVCVLILFQACASPSPAPVIDPTKTATLVPPTSTPTPTVTPTSMPTPIPLAWTQVFDGQNFERDTVTAFATDNTDPNIIYAGMKNSGIYKTIDEGLSWQPVNQGLVSKKVESLFIDSQDPLILYAGTIGGTYKTVDGGENWSRVGEGIYLLMDNQNNSHLYARDENAIYETTDQGITWEVMHPLEKDCPNVVNSWAIHPTNGNMLFVGGGETCAGVYQSIDNESSWTLIGLEDKPNINNLAIGLGEQGNYSIYASLPFKYSPLVENGLFVSRDGGINWSQKDEWGCNGTLLIADPSNPSDVYCDLSVWRGGNGPWKNIPNTQSKAYSTFHIDRPNNIERILTGAADVSDATDSDVGIYISEDGGDSWVERSSGIGSAWAELKIDPLENTRIFLGTYYEILYGSTNIGCTLYRSLGDGKNWSPIKVRAGWCGPTFDAANVLYMDENGKLQKSWDGGETWWWNRRDMSNYNPNTGRSIDGSLAYALPSYYKDGLYFEGSQSISANPFIAGLVYDVGAVIYYSADAGLSWQLSEGSDGSQDARLFYTDQSKVIFAIGRTNQSFSTDNGKTWQVCGEDVTTSQSDSRLALDLQGERLYLATPGQGILVSADECGSWQESNNGLDNLFVNTIAMDPNNNNILYAGTDGGVYVTFDGGGTWGQVNDGLIGSNIVYSIAVDGESNVYSATPYGVFKLEQK